jgi:hypothetical protein
VKTIAVILLSFLLALINQTAYAKNQTASLRIDPTEIPIKLFYSGAHVHVTGVSRGTPDLLLLCTGETHTVELKEKQQLWGFLWVSAGDISFHNVPSFYALVTSNSNGIALSEWTRAGLGFSAMEAQVVPQAAEERQHRCFSELLKLKKHEGVYSIQEKGLEVHPLGDGWQEFSTDVFFPSATGPGTYRFHLMGYDEGKAVELAGGMVSVRLAGTAAFIRSLSLEHGLLYGIFSVLVALCAGLLTGLVFGRRSRKFGH